MLTPVGLENLLDVMKLMAATERLIAEFYRTGADIWEEDRAFWLATVAEEEKHAANIEKMARIVAARPDRFEIGRPFNPAAIRTIMTGVEGHLKRLKEGRVARDRLMIVARDIEISLMEKAYGEIVRTTDVEYLELVREILEETAHHRQSIERRCRTLTAPGGTCAGR